MTKTIDTASHPGPALRAARIDQGLTLRDLAARTGLPYSTLSKLENGKMAMTYDKLVRLAQGLGVSNNSADIFSTLGTSLFLDRLALPEMPISPSMVGPPIPWSSTTFWKTTAATTLVAA